MGFKAATLPQAGLLFVFFIPSLLLARQAAPDEVEVINRLKSESFRFRRRLTGLKARLLCVEQTAPNKITRDFFLAQAR